MFSHNKSSQVIEESCKFKLDLFRSKRKAEIHQDKNISIDVHNINQISTPSKYGIILFKSKIPEIKVNQTLICN